MKKGLFFLLFAFLFVMSCNSPGSKNTQSTDETSEDYHDMDDTVVVEAIDDSGEALAEDSIYEITTDTSGTSVIEEDDSFEIADQEKIDSE